MIKQFLYKKDCDFLDKLPLRDGALGRAVENALSEKRMRSLSQRGSHVLHASIQLLLTLLISSTLH